MIPVDCSPDEFAYFSESRLIAFTTDQKSEDGVT